MESYVAVSSIRVVPDNGKYGSFVFVEYPASALFTEERQHGIEERGGGGEDKEGVTCTLDRYATLYANQVNVIVCISDEESLTST